jgi:long-chain acyl-CoA synthetase
MSPRQWLASYDHRIPVEIDPDAARSVVELLEGAMRRYAGQPAFRCAGQTLTYAAADRLSRAFARYLQGPLGVRKGDRVAVMLPNVLAFPLATMGVMRAGAGQVNVNPLYTPRELEHQLKDAGARTVVVFAGVSATLAEIIGRTRVERIVVAGAGDGGGAVADADPVDQRLAGAIRFADALTEGAALTFTPVPIDGDDLLFLQYTGGTTGVSKGAALSHRNLVANTEQFRAFLYQACRPGAEVVVTALPLYHVFALMVNLLSLLLAGRRELAGAQPARSRRPGRRAGGRPLHRAHGSQHALRGAGPPPAHRPGGLLPPARRHRRWGGGSSHHLRALEGGHRARRSSRATGCPRPRRC